MLTGLFGANSLLKIGNCKPSSVFGSAISELFAISFSLTMVDYRTYWFKWIALIPKRHPTHYLGAQVSTMLAPIFTVNCYQFPVFIIEPLFFRKYRPPFWSPHFILLILLHLWLWQLQQTDVVQWINIAALHCLLHPGKKSRHNFGLVKNYKNQSITLDNHCK